MSIVRRCWWCAAERVPLPPLGGVVAGDEAVVAVALDKG